MATVIDSLLIELGIDTSKFDAGQKKSVEELRKFDEQAQKTSKNTQQGAKNVGDGFDKARNALISLGVSLVGIKGFTSLAAEMTTTNSALGRTSQLFSMSARELDAWGGVLKSVGGDANDFQASVQAMQQGIANIKLGNAAIMTPLAQLGALDAMDVNKNTMDIYKLADALKAYSKTYGEQQAYALAQQIGLNQNMFMVLKQGSGVVRELYGDSYKLSGVTEENTQKAEKLQKQWGGVSNAFQGAKNQIMDQLYPSLGKLAEGTQFSLEKFVEWDKALKGGLSNMLVGAGSVASLMAGLRALGVTFSTQIATIGSWGAALEGVVASPWFARLTGALGLLTYSSGLNKGEDEEVRKMHEAQDKAMGVRRDSTGRIVEKDGKVVGADFSGLEQKYSLPAGMLDKIWNIETQRGKGNMVSKAGATGHFQFMPETAKQYGMTREDTFDLGKSSEAAARMMSDLMKKYNNNTDMALAAYNWGSGNLDRYGLGKAPLETQKYLQKYNAGGSGQASKSAYSPYTATMDYNAMLNNKNVMGASQNSPIPQNGGNTSVENNIGAITVNTQATDGKDVVAELNKAVQNHSLINLGMQGNR